ncbi:hypothetical protein [Paraburkholderia sp. RL17-373-BIF-A]|uniref:hypothetical protein n=1 Tax=Paraburkholderia sp. RL17-373-BIF-A TaxID=3031629 RepID=UPI0038B73001
MDLKKAAVDDALRHLREEIQANPEASSVSVQVDGQELTVSYNLHGGVNRLKITLGAHEFEPIDGVTLKDLRARLENVSQPFAGDDVHLDTPDTLRESAANVNQWEPEGVALLQRIQSLPAQERNGPLVALIDRIPALPDRHQSGAFEGLLAAVLDLDGLARGLLLSALGGQIRWLPDRLVAFDSLLRAVCELDVADRARHLAELAARIGSLCGDTQLAAFGSVVAAVRDLGVSAGQEPLVVLAGLIGRLREDDREAAREMLRAF